MRIVQLVDFDRPHAGSFIPMLVGLISEAQSQGHGCEVVFLDSSRDLPWLEEFESRGIPVVFAPHTSGRVRLGRWLRQHLSSETGPVAIHTHFTTWDVPAQIAARGFDSAVFWHVHSALPRKPLVVARTTFKFLLFRSRIAGVLCPAPNIVEGARRRLSPADRTHFIPSSLDLEEFPLLGDERRAAARKELGIEPDAKVLLHFGWHWHLKGSDIFLETLRRLAEADPKIIGIDRGGGPEMTVRAEEMGLGKRFRLIPPVDDVRTVHGAADVMVSSSREEGMAYAVLESLASGTPVVATAIPGHAFLGTQIRACRLTSVDPAELAGAVSETLGRTDEQARQEAEEAHAWMADNLAHAPVARRVVRLYDDALPSGRPPQARGARGDATRPRLIHVCDYANSRGGSFVPMVASVIERAQDRGWEAEAIFARPAGGWDWHADLRDRGIAFRTAPGGSRFELFRWANTLAHEQEGPTIVHTHFTRYDLPVALSAERDKLAVVWHQHTALSARPDVVARNNLKFRIGNRRVESIVCPSPDLAEQTVERGALEERVRFIPNAIDPGRFGIADPASRTEARRKLGIGDDALVVLCFGWHWEVKGGRLFHEAVARLSGSFEGDLVALHSTNATKALKSARELGIEDSLRLIEPTDDVPSLLAAADVFVSASRAEGGTPLAILEALSSGTPVVATDLPSHRYVAVRVPNISIVDRDSGEMAGAILKAVSAPGDERNELSLRAHTAIESEFSFDRWCDSLFEIYEVALSRISR